MRPVMLRLPLVAVLAAGVVVTGCATTEPSLAASSASSVLFADEFNGPAGPVGAPWQAEVGGGGWGNNEMQDYTGDTANVRIDGSGHLAITARRSGGVITSGRLTTLGRYSVTDGRVSARIVMPAGQGLHPAFWLLGDNLRSAGWPAAGEIDVIETLNDAADYHTGIHAPRASAPRGQNISASGPAPMPLAGQARTYWLRKSPGRIETGIDDLRLLTVTRGDLAADAQWVFDAPFHLILNLAVGGDWPGPPDASTPNPSTMLVDWVRVERL